MWKHWFLFRILDTILYADPILFSSLYVVFVCNGTLFNEVSIFLLFYVCSVWRFGCIALKLSICHREISWEFEIVECQITLTTFCHLIRITSYLMISPTRLGQKKKQERVMIFELGVVSKIIIIFKSI